MEMNESKFRQTDTDIANEEHIQTEVDEAQIQTDMC